MFNRIRSIRSIKNCCSINIRYLSINKSNLIESSQNIQIILKNVDEKSPGLKWFYSSINEIHQEYPSKNLAKSTKNIYQINSSKLNSIYLKLENDRTNSIETFGEEDSNRLIVLLRYIRYLEVASIYRLITFDIKKTFYDLHQSIVDLTRGEQHFNNNFFSLTCELTFFVNYLLCNHSLSYVNSLLSSTIIRKTLSNCLFEMLSKENNILLVNQICLTLYSIREIPSSVHSLSNFLLKYLNRTKSDSLFVIKYLILIQQNCSNESSSENLSILNDYLTKTGIYQENLYKLCQLLVLTSSFNYSHELFQNKTIQMIKNFLKQLNDKENPLYDIKLCSRLIYYLCLTDPTNRFESRSILIELSEKLNENLTNKEMKSPQWIVQCQHGLMLLNIYNFELLFSTVQHKYFPLLFRDLGISSSTIYRQLFDIHYALAIDRPSVSTPLLNDQMLSFANKISNEYRSDIRINQKSYYQFLNQLKEFFNKTYGQNTCRIIDTNQHYPFILFDFLELNLPNNDQLKSIGINTNQRIAVLPISNSMLIKQKRSNGSLVRVLNAQTIMRYRIIQKNNYQVLLIYHGEFIRAMRNKTFKNIFEKHLALKSLPHQSDNHSTFHL